MRFYNLALGGLLAAAALGQTRVDLRTQAKDIDFSGASSTKPSKTGTALPATCNVGEMFFKTDALAGQNLYACTSANTWKVQGSLAPDVTGNANKVLSTDGSTMQWWSLGGDVSGSPTGVSVNKLVGRTISNAAPSTGQVLGWSGTQWAPQSLGLTSVFGRSGAVTAQTGDYSFSQLSGSVAAGQLPNTGGDLSGGLTSPTVVGLQTRAVANTAPSTGQVLGWSGAQWAPQSLGLISVFGRSGAVTAQSGDYTAVQITNAVDKTAATMYTAGARQTFAPAAAAAGLRVTPGSLPTTPQSGDVVVDSTDSNRAKVFNGTSWVNMTSTPNYSNAFTSATTVTVLGSSHKMGTANLVAAVFDNSSPAKVVEPDAITINPSTYDVTVTFAAAQSGTVVLNAAGGSGTKPIISGAGIVATDLGSQVQIATDSMIVPSYLSATATLDFASINSQSCGELTLPLTGAVAGDAVAPGWPGGLEAGLIGTMRVSAANTITVRLCNFSGSALNPASTSFRATVLH